MVAQDRACLFGEAVDGEMRVNDAGAMVCDAWNALPRHYPGVDVDVVVVMPNHVHGIIVLTVETPTAPSDATSVGAGPRACPGPEEVPRACPGPEEVPRACPGPDGAAALADTPVDGVATSSPGQPRGVAPTSLSLSEVVRRLKTLTTKLYSDGVHGRGWVPYRDRLWQRNFYEHVIRNQASLEQHRSYIIENPRRWGEDQENVTVHGHV
jgi:REP element-mobilizing transposase RayT